MDRIAISLGPISIYWYSIMILLGILVAVTLAFIEVKKQCINKDFYTNLIFWVLVYGIIGARLYYVLFNLEYYLANPTEIIKIWHGGLAIHGGIIAGIIVILIYTKKYNVNSLKIMDISVIGGIIAQAIGRWGNFFNQEAFGQITTRATLESQHIPKFIIDGMYINGNYYQPTFLYESLWNVLGFFIMLFLRRRKYNKVGELTGFYLIWYSIGRFAIEHFRSDSLMIGNFKVAQLISGILVLIGFIIIINSRRGSRFENLYNKVADKNEIRF